MKEGKEDLRVIRGSEAHADACMEIARGLRTHFNDVAMEQMPRDLRSHRLYVAEDDEAEVVGFLTILLRSERVAEVSWMGVRPELHRQGIGTALISTAVDELVEQERRILEVKTLADTVDYRPYEGTRAFYVAMGFSVLDIIDPYPGWPPGNPCAIYVRSLP